MEVEGAESWLTGNPSENVNTVGREQGAVERAAAVERAEWLSSIIDIDVRAENRKIFEFHLILNVPDTGLPVIAH